MTKHRETPTHMGAHFPKTISGVCVWYHDLIPEHITVLSKGKYRGMDEPIKAYCARSKTEMTTSMRRLTRGTCCNICRKDKLRVLRQVIESHPDYNSEGRSYTLDHRLFKQAKDDRETFRIIHDKCGTAFTATYEEALEYQANKSCPFCKEQDSYENNLKKELDLDLGL